MPWVFENDEDGVAGRENEQWLIRDTESDSEFDLVAAVPKTGDEEYDNNSDSAVLFKENTKWDGRNHISVPTGSQWEHEWLYYTKSGNWVLHSWSNYQGRGEGYVQIDESEAITWLIQNECFEGDEIKKLPTNVQESVKTGFAAAEI